MKEKSFSIFLKTFQITHFENTFLVEKNKKGKTNFQ